MSAQTLQIVTLVFADPAWLSNSAAPGLAFQRVNSSISFAYLTSSNLRTLSTNGASAGNDVTGLLYVPDLAPTDPCARLVAPYVPANVTSQRNLPHTDYELVGLAPWISATCTQSYLAAAHGTPIQGFIFFLPDNGTATPPDQSDPVWDLGDNGQWKSGNKFPVYAVPGQVGQAFISASSQYSGNMSSVPYGGVLTNYYDPKDYVRLFVDIQTGTSGTLPSLWVFLLIVLGILLAVISATSLSVHVLQRRRRHILRRRVANGEVDLEALGIKRLTVPQDLLDKMPLYTYGSGARVPPSAARNLPVLNPTSSGEEDHEKASAESSRPSSPVAPAAPTSARSPRTPHRGSSYHPTPLQQSTCAICLDDFSPASSPGGKDGTIVRELPCKHIFHPTCVDAFLRDNSSLCPLCKNTALPKGYCPTVVTNAMVRRERIVRRLRESGVSGGVEAAAQADENGRTHDSNAMLGRGGRRTPAFPTWMTARWHHALDDRSQSQRMTDMPVPLSSLQPPVAAGPEAVGDVPEPATPLPREPHARREWARARAVAMLGARRAPVDPDAEEAMVMSGWRKTLSRLFPTLGASGVRT